MPAGGGRAHFGQQQARALIRLDRRSRSEVTMQLYAPAEKEPISVPRIEIGSFSAGA